MRIYIHVLRTEEVCRKCMKRANEKRDGRITKNKVSIGVWPDGVSVIRRSVLRIYYSGLVIGMQVKDGYCITDGSVSSN